MSFEIRRLADGDSFEELTALLHRAYSVLAQLGFRFLATHQNAEVTEERCKNGECFVAVGEGRLVGTITFYPVSATGGCSWYDRPEVSSFGQFAVEPSLQRSGLGSRLLGRVEKCATDSGAREFALDTAEGATHLIEFYKRRGFRDVGLADWSETNYQSLILSKPI